LGRNRRLLILDGLEESLVEQSAPVISIRMAERCIAFERLAEREPEVVDAADHVGVVVRPTQLQGLVFSLQL
jgi:hypothetical protein